MFDRSYDRGLVQVRPGVAEVFKKMDDIKKKAAKAEEEEEEEEKEKDD